MRLGDIYKHKQTNEIIQIDSFATRMSEPAKDMIIVFNNMFNNGGNIGYAPSFCGYGTQDLIESEYELLVSQEDLDKYKSWEEIFELIKK